MKIIIRRVRLEEDDYESIRAAMDGGDPAHLGSLEIGEQWYETTVSKVKGGVRIKVEDEESDIAPLLDETLKKPTLEEIEELIAKAFYSAVLEEPMCLIGRYAMDPVELELEKKGDVDLDEINAVADDTAIAKVTNLKTVAVTPRRFDLDDDKDLIKELLYQRLCERRK